MLERDNEHQVNSLYCACFAANKSALVSDFCEEDKTAHKQDVSKAPILRTGSQRCQQADDL